MSSVGVCVSVTRGASTILRERLLRIPDTCSLKDLLSKIATDASLTLTPDQCAEASVKCSKQATSPCLDASLADDVGLLVNDFGCRYIRFQLPLTEVAEPLPKRVCRSVTDVLLGEARSRNKLPKPKRVPEKNSKEKLFNNVRSLLLSKDVGFSPLAAESEGFSVVNCLTNVLWAIDACHDTLRTATSKKGCTKIPRLPEVWEKFQGYNDYKLKKVAKPRLHSSTLKEFALELFRIVGLPSLQFSDWYQTREEIEGLANTLDGYADHMVETNQAQQKRQSVEHPPRQVCAFHLEHA